MGGVLRTLFVSIARLNGSLGQGKIFLYAYFDSRRLLCFVFSFTQASPFHARIPPSSHVLVKCIAPSKDFGYDANRSSGK